MFLLYLEGINLFEPNTTFFIVLFLDHRILLTKMPHYNYTAIISISLFSFLWLIFFCLDLLFGSAFKLSMSSKYLYTNLCCGFIYFFWNQIEPC